MTFPQVFFFFFFCDLDRICLTRQLSLFQRNKKETADTTVKLKKANL